MIVTLRDYQQKAVDAIKKQYLMRKRAPLLVLPTASGKTIIFTHIAEEVYKRNKRATILVHRQELLNQTSKHLARLGVQHSCIAPGYSMTGDNIQIASVQTLVHRLDRWQVPDLLVIDEAHHVAAGSWKKVLGHAQSSLMLGVTATPVRLDGKGLGVLVGGFFDCLVEGPKISELISMGYLAPPILYAPPVGYDGTGVATVRGDYDNKEVNRRIDKPHITGCAVQHYQQICPGVPAIAFCASVAHAEHVAEQFNSAGIHAASLTGKMSDRVREWRINALASGEIKVLTSCDIISEGTDIPVVSAAILLRPTKSLGLYMQQVGRALRIHPNKTYSFILDHVNNWKLHGLPDDERQWDLNAGKSRKRDMPKLDTIVTCPVCFAVVPHGVICPQCGAVLEKKAASHREIKQVDGTLVQITHEERMKIRKREKFEEHNAETLSDFMSIARRRGYKTGWAYKRYQLKQLRRMPVNPLSLAMAG